MSHAEQHVGLVFGGIDSLLQDPTITGVLDLGVMTGGYVGSLQRRRPVHQKAELDLVVAGDTGMGSPALAVFPAKVVDDVFLKLLLHVEYIVGNSQAAADHTGVFHVVQRATTLVRRRQVCLVQAIQLHGHADHVEPLPL